MINSLPAIAVFETTAVVANGNTTVHSLQLLNVIVQTDSYVLSLVRYIPDFVEFHQLIKCHYHKVKIPFPVLDQQHPPQGNQKSNKRTSTTTKRRSSLRKLFGSLHHHGHSKRKTNAEKVELYLQQCLLDPVVSQSSIVRDFLSIQRDEDQKLPTKSTTEDTDNNINSNNSNSSHNSVPFNDANRETSVGAPATPPIVRRTTQPDDTHNKNQQQVPDTNIQHESVTTPNRDVKIEIDTNSQKVPRSLSVKSDMVSLHDLIRESASPPPIPVMDSPLQVPSSSSSSSAAASTTTQDQQKQQQYQTPHTHPFPLEYFEMMTVLGKGCMGKVFLVKSTQNHQLYALKSIVKDLVIEQREITHTLTEREILATLADIRHPNLARLYLAFQDIHRLHLITDYYCGGDLATQMSTCMTFSKRRTLFYAAEMIEGIGELHRLGILYRDLKPENILLTKQGHVVLTDFGLSKWLVETDQTDTFCGTAEYLAPELLTGEPYSFGIDHWSYGTILYEMLTGITPFWADNHMEMYRRILEDPLDFPAQDENGLPEIDYDTADFLAGLLDRDPRTRLGAQGVDEIKSHAYFTGISWDDVYHQRLQPAYVPILSSHTDFANFDASFLEMDPVLTPVGSQVNLTQDIQDVFEDYSFTNSELCPTPLPNITSSLPVSDDALVPTPINNHDDEVDDDDLRDQHPPTFQPARKRGSVSMLSDVDSFHLESPLLQHEQGERTIKRRNTHDDNAVGGNDIQINEDKSMDTMDLSKKMTMTMTTSDSSYTGTADDDMVLHSSSLVPDMLYLDSSRDKQQQQQQQQQTGLDQLDFGNGDLDLRFSIQVNEKHNGFAANRTTPVKPKKQKYSPTRRLLSPFIRF
ncbi:kinase-like domain-containing protein [Chlamydoabsidia padenii]|nr:kinase-like domain-containing protein [Chlamydoabsidia padenii]